MFNSDPHNISFNFLIPERGTDKSPYYKLKAVLPDSNVTVARWGGKKLKLYFYPGHYCTLIPVSLHYSQKKIEDKLNVATPEGNLFWSFPNELSPIIIGTTQFSQKRYVYISADSIVKVLTLLYMWSFTQTCHWVLWKN